VWKFCRPLSAVLIALIHVVSACVADPSRTSPSPAPDPALGWDLGQRAPDVDLPDQRGETVHLSDFAGDVVMVALSACWCAPCRDLARESERLAARFADQGFVPVTVLLEDVSGLPVAVDEAAGWAAELGVTEPVLADRDQRTRPALAAGFPTVVLLDRERVVVGVTDAADPDALAALVESEPNR
jgi:peroxiredoxin